LFFTALPAARAEGNAGYRLGGNQVINDAEGKYKGWPHGGFKSEI